MSQPFVDISARIGICRKSVFLAGLVLLTAPGMFADTLQFALIPSSGNVSGMAGSTVGWGYSITNQSSADWLVTTNLTADSFLDGTPSLVFDFPIVGPGQTATETFNASTGVGLYQLTWDANAPMGFVNSGDFVLSAQWWNGNPANGGTLIADAPDTSAAYAATVSTGTSMIPEPSMGLLCFVLFFLGTFVVRRRRTA